MNGNIRYPYRISTLPSIFYSGLCYGSTHTISIGINTCYRRDYPYWRSAYRGNTMKPKFTIGDKARFTSRVPKYILQDIPRRRTRTIMARSYSQDEQCCFYCLGDRGRYGEFYYWMRSYQLVLANGRTGTIGRPRQKRNYNLKLNSDLSHQINSKGGYRLDR